MKSPLDHHDIPFIGWLIPLIQSFARYWRSFEKNNCLYTKSHLLAGENHSIPLLMLKSLYICCLIPLFVQKKFSRISVPFCPSTYWICGRWFVQKLCNGKEPLPMGFSIIIHYLDLLKMNFYFLYGKSTIWGIYREYFLFSGGSLSKSMIIIPLVTIPLVIILW